MLPFNTALAHFDVRVALQYISSRSYFHGRIGFSAQLPGYILEATSASQSPGPVYNTYMRMRFVSIAGVHHRRHHLRRGDICTLAHSRSFCRSSVCSPCLFWLGEVGRCLVLYYKCVFHVFCCAKKINL